ncbi:MAG: LysM peptidoglycan-binding domain-containing protein [bacterium]|nr:LysM peptidoglycan-binding domain-containing protein [bacterium]
MNIIILNKKSFFLIIFTAFFIVQVGCLKKAAQNNLMDQKLAESPDPEKLASDVPDLKQDSLNDPKIAVSSKAGPATESNVINNDPLILINDNRQSKSVIENIPSLEEVVNNTSNNEILEEDTAEVIINDVNNKKQDEQIVLKDGKALIQEHYSKALSFYDSGEYDKAKAELNVCLKMTADLDLDIETLFRFSDIYKDVFESTATMEVTAEQNILTDSTVDSTVLDINIVQEEKMIMEGLDNGGVIYDFPVEFNEEVKRYIKLYTTSNHKAMAGRLARSGKYIAMMKEIFKNEGLPQDLAYLPLIESAYKVKAYSRAGAGGLWQFMRKTGQRYSLKSDWSVDERYDPVASTKAAAKYLKDLYKIFDSWLLAEAAYNAGEYRILRAMGLAVSRDFWYIASKNILARETKGYVAAFMANLIIAKNPEKFGFTNIPYEQPLEYDEVVIENCVELSFASRLAECSVEELKAMNPALLKWCTPIDYPNFVLKIPKGKAEAFNTNLTKIAKTDPNGKIGWTQHVVKSGETMSTISWKYGIPIGSIAKANNIGNVNRISVGTRLFIPYGKNSSPDEVASIKDESGYKKIEYIVQSGDTLWEIGKKYNITLNKIREWNIDFSGKEHIFPGQKIAIWIKEEEM